MNKNHENNKIKGKKPVVRRTMAAFLALALAFSTCTGSDVLAKSAKKAAKEGTDGLHLQYSFGSPVFEAGAYGYQVLLDDAFSMNEAGMPDLPSKTVSVLIPKGKTIKNVNISRSGMETYENLLVAPSMGLSKITEDVSGGATIAPGENEPAPAAETALQQETAVSDNTTNAGGDTQENLTEQTEGNLSADAKLPEGADAEEGTAQSADTDAGSEVVQGADAGTQEKQEQAAGEAETIEGVGIGSGEAAEEMDASGKNGDKKEVTKKILSDTIDFTNSDVFNQSVYSGTSVYPSSSSSEGTLQTVRGFNVYTITLFPMTYTGTTLTYTRDMTVDVTFADADDNAGYVPDEEDLSFLSDDVDVSQFKNTYFASTAKVKTGTTIAGKGKIDYIIVTSKALSKTFQKLADYKESKGLRAAVVTTDKIYKRYKGYDKAERIRNFLKDAYQKNRVTYVLLGGDGDNKTNSSKAVVPARLLYCKPVASGEKATMIASDLYYGCLDGTFDYNKNHVYGEEKDGVKGKDIDLRADVYVGRAPVDNKKEAENFVKKTIGYETRAKDAKALMIGEQLNGNISCSVELASQLQDDMDADTLSDTIRRLRDEKIRDEYVDLYYDANSFVKSVYLDHLSLLGETVSLLTEYQPVINEYLMTGKTTRTLEKADILCLQEYCAKLSDAIANSPRAYSQKQKLMEELSRFSRYVGTCEGMSYADMFENSYICADPSEKSDAASYEKLDAIYGKTYKEEIRLGSSANDMKTRAIPSNYTVGTLYDMDGEWTQQQVIDLLNASPEMINHLGHANVDSLMKLTVKQIKALSNKNAFFFYSQGCYDGSFDNSKTNGKYSKNDSIAEELLVSSAKSGAFACVVNSRYGWYNSDASSTKGPSQIFDRLFWDEAFYGKDKSLGAILAKSRESKNVLDNFNHDTYGAVLRYCYYELNLLGDPETKLQDLKDPCLSQTTLKVKKSGTKRSLSWSSVSGADKYIVYRADSKNGTYNKIGETKSLSYQDNSAKNAACFYKVAAFKKVSGKKYYRYSKTIKSGK